jgi:hypothetical protein
MFYVLLPALLLGGFVFYASKKPDTFIVKREALINATPDAIYPFLADLHKWTQWSPWEGRDANMQRIYSGEESGVGAKYEYIGNNKVGHGQMEVVEAARTFVRINLHFLNLLKRTTLPSFVWLLKAIRPVSSGPCPVRPI